MIQQLRLHVRAFQCLLRDSAVAEFIIHLFTLGAIRLCVHIHVRVHEYISVHDYMTIKDKCDSSVHSFFAKHSVYRMNIYAGTYRLSKFTNKHIVFRP